MQIKGRIIKGISGFYYVCDEHSRIFVCKARGIFRKNDIKPLVGDLVLIEQEDESADEGNIVEILPRKNTLLRPAVSNIDNVLIVFATSSPLPSFNLLDKLLIYYRAMNIPITICFNKSDLITKEEINTIKDIYKDSDVKVIFSNFSSGVVNEEITSLLRGRATVVTGPSGVGKSTLINLLIPDACMDTGEISLKLKRGKHTTRHAELFALDGNTYIFDTPGFTSFDLENINEFEIKEYYPEFTHYNDACKYLDCNHIGEIDCGVKNAINCGKISKIRYDNYKIIYEDIKLKKHRR